MAKKARQRISYVIDSAKSSPGGHRLGVNGLAIDGQNSILYSGGRDGIICAWDVTLDPKRRSADTRDNASDQQPTSTFRTQTQAHMHWINDIALAQNNTALVSASSDLAVKIWRPHSEEDGTRAVTIGEHADYVKCVATPPQDVNANWVASGGLDRKICLWDLNGGGKTLEIDVRGEDMTEKGSVYALSVGRSIMASGGPEKSVRLHDPRTGSKISKLLGHVDNIRSILIDEAGDTIMSASGDKTIKMWSVKGGRCMYTFTMHDESVWSLFSNHPQLGIFYSADRSGIVAKTDVRGGLEDIDDGISLAVANEHAGVSKMVAAGGHIWTATNQSSINCWEDVTIGANVQLPEPYRHQRLASAQSGEPPEPSQPQPNGTVKEIPAQSILRISHTANFPVRSAPETPATNGVEQDSARRGSHAVVDHFEGEVKPIRLLPTETIEGQFGLLKHLLLNDRRRVLTLDTAGDVLLWDLVKCKPIQSFRKQHLDDVEPLVNTLEAVAPWCSIDLSSGNLTVVLEPFNCFDAEVYADEIEVDEPIEFREDQRLILGKWVLRYLFANLIDEEIKRDEAYRRKLNEDVEKRLGGSRSSAPTTIALPQSPSGRWNLTDQGTPRANGAGAVPPTPGLAIGLATPGPTSHLANVPEDSVASAQNASLEKTKSHASRQSTEREDYFSAGIAPADSGTKQPATPAPEEKKEEADKSKDKDKAIADNGKSPTTPFGKKFRMSFGSKKLGRSSSQATTEKPAVVDEKAEESESSSTHEKEVEDSFFGVIQKIRNDYDKQLAEAPDKAVESLVRPSLAQDTPVLKLPPTTKIFIQEETSGGSANIYQGTVGNVGKDADFIEQKAPMWLGDVLLQNRIPIKDPVKISFVLHPIDDLPAISVTDGNNRLNANRMLRVKKIMAYVAERIEPPAEEPEPDALSPEEYLEIYCNDQLLSPNMSLATLRTHVWKGGNDIVLYYKSNGKKRLRPFVTPAPEPANEPDDTVAASPAAAPEGSNAAPAS